jgi:hypothetical protein
VGRFCGSSAHTNPGKDLSRPSQLSEPGVDRPDPGRIDGRRHQHKQRSGHHLHADRVRSDDHRSWPPGDHCTTYHRWTDPAPVHLEGVARRPPRPARGTTKRRRDWPRCTGHESSSTRSDNVAQRTSQWPRTGLKGRAPGTWSVARSPNPSCPIRARCARKHRGNRGHERCQPTGLPSQTGGVAPPNLSRRRPLGGLARPIANGSTRNMPTTGERTGRFGVWRTGCFHRP